MTFTGDVRIGFIDEYGDFVFDIKFENGQPIMTNAFISCVLLAIFGEDCYVNDIVETESEKMKSEFPEVIRRGVVSDDTKKDGTAALEKALEFMVTDGLCSAVSVTGEIISVYAIGWEIVIENDGLDTRFKINWENGVLTATFEEAA